MADSTSQPHGLLDADSRHGATLAGHRIADSIADFAAHLQGASGNSAELTPLIVEAAIKLVPGADHAVVSPVRLLDTRSGVGAARHAVPAGGRVTVQIAGRGGVPTGASGAVLNLTVTNTARGGYLQVVAHGASAGTSTVNFAAGQTAANAVFTALSGSGQVDIINHSAPPSATSPDSSCAAASPPTGVHVASRSKSTFPMPCRSSTSKHPKPTRT